MKTSRRKFLTMAALGTAGVLSGRLFASGDDRAIVASAADAVALPWLHQPPLREMAKAAFMEGVLNPDSAQASSEGLPLGPAFQISNLGIRSTLWGPSHQPTLSLLKNDVWDRRIVQSPFPTLAEVTAAAFAPGAASYNGTPDQIKHISTRPNWGMLQADGRMVDPLAGNRKAVMKNTGQILLGMDDLQDAPMPKIRQSCADGSVRFTIRKRRARADMEYILSMTENVWGIRGTWTGLQSPIKLRIYRNRDTKLSSGIEPPQSGTDGRFFWVHQRLPAEKTFPNGFECVLMGLVDDPAVVTTLTTENGKRDLGTPSPDRYLRDAPGAAATAEFVPQNGRRTAAFVAIVSTVDASGGDVMAEARNRLVAAQKIGFDGLVAQNAAWYGDHYDRRENGRTFHAHAADGESMAEIFSSWYCKHGGATKTDMRKHQASAHYCEPELSDQPYSGLPCYNEVFYTHRYVANRADSVDMWRQIVEYWADAARQNARDVFGLPGMYLAHGFLPPVKADSYVHTNFGLEFAVDTMAQLVKPVWDEWDYGGDETYLRETAYPLLRQMCLFYAAYARKGSDGRYHILPSMQEEVWGFYPNFSHSTDCIAALCLFQWAFRRTSEAAQVLGVDSDLWPGWMEVADHLADYPTWKKREGVVFAGVAGVEPWRGKGEHPWDVGCYPTLLADDITLDSDPQLQEQMLRTVRVLRSAGTNETQVLLGRPGERADRQRDLALSPGVSPERWLNSRSGRLHLFPCPPKSAVAFRRFQARGGFLVSACHDGHRTVYLEIESRRSVLCRLMNPWPGCLVQVRRASTGAALPITVDTTNGECLLFDTEPGGRYLAARA